MIKKHKHSSKDFLTKKLFI